MSKLQNLGDIKIPYPIEGVIRTAQLDDPVAPADSVQLAVNMNFDRVGAIQTRPGVTSYADSLVEEIKSFGTLRNSIVPPGYEFIFQLGATYDINPDITDPWAVKVNDTKVAIFWTGADGDGFVRLFEIDQETGVVTPLGTALEFDTSNASNVRAVLHTTDRIIAAWTGAAGDGFARAFNVSGTSAVGGTPLEFDATNGSQITMAKIDSTHVIVFYTDNTDGLATVLAINNTSLAVTEPGATLTFQAGTPPEQMSCVAVGDGTHFINSWFDGTTGGLIQCFTVNTGTWAITAEDSPVAYSLGLENSIAALGDGSHFVLACQGSGGEAVAQTYALNLSTFALTALGTQTSINGASINEVFLVAYGDGQHFAAIYRENSDNGYVQMLEVNLSTFAVSTSGERILHTGLSNNGFMGIALSTNEILLVYSDEDDEGFAAFFQSFGDVVDGRWLYAGHGDEVSNLPAGSTTWTSRRSGLAEVSKPRFSQYLNYIWMVNGNELLGGDPVATSNGGNFGTDLVPENFPAGDFIHAGFEGRVWVANKTLGIIYYTDIVQFIPPATYKLTYNPDVNYITTISPQTGQSFTALYRVPRALLVFTEDTITRIYGATSLDAYPAYNVGTFSQESIIETKTGIFFHHSSGFYQFDYGSQPVEISRRIIDFVKAIDRDYYGEITGVWDGFDNVEWSIGQVTVEGVTFVNCVVRFTISTQVWTIYDYVGNVITAMIYYDDGVNLNHLMGTEAGLTGAMDTGVTDFGQPFYFEYIDRWRAFTEMYYLTKSLSGLSVHSENAAGANVSYQVQKSGPNAWEPLFTITEANNSLSPNTGTIDFDVLRLRIAGNTKGAQVVIHGVEITQLTVKGQEAN